jgi:signal transduction histidine kinase/ligand-binding sensor domain-containing protein/CheY-like chemotaxis protein
MPGRRKGRLYFPGCPARGTAKLRERIQAFLAAAVFFFLTHPFALYSQDSPLRFVRISLEQNLSQSAVHCILQDDKGFMWFGTEDGLNRYDGHRFVIYRPDSGNPKSLSNNWITCMLIDRRGTFWIGTQDGLNTFDFETGTFRHPLQNAKYPNSLSHNSIKCLWEDSAGNLWIGTLRGLNRLNRQTGHITRYLHQPGAPGTLSHDTICSLLEDRSGILWIGTQGGGINQWDPEKERYITYKHNPLDPRSLSHNTVNCLYQDRSGVIWIGTGGEGLDRFEPKTRTFSHYRANSHQPGSLSHNDVTAIYQDRSGILWIGTRGGGLDQFEQDKGTFIRHQLNPSDAFSLSHNIVLSIYEDRFHVLWAGTWDGLNKSDRERKAFNHYKVEPGNPYSLGSKEVRALYQDRRGILWVGLDGRGLDRWDPRTRRFSHYRADPAKPHSLSHDDVRVICEDSRDRLWIGTDGGGLNRLDRQTYRFTAYRADPTVANSISSNRIYSLLEDQAGTLWIGTFGGGLNRLNDHTDPPAFIHYRAAPPGSDDSDNRSHLSSDFIRILYQDRQGNLWIGTEGGGLNRFHPPTQRFTHYRCDPTNPNTLSSDIIFSLHEDRQGNLWIGTDGGGLNRYDPGKNIFTHYNTTHGLPNNVIYGILEDEQANLWLSTNFGLSRFNPRTRTFKNYTVSDSLQSNEFNANAYFKSKTGEMFFGGINGFNSFYPDTIKDNSYLPPLVITDFKIFNRSILPGREFNERVILQKPITRTHEIELTYKENVFSLEFAALHYAAPEKNQYAYIMEGLEKKWNYVMERRFVTYANIPPGAYVFHVKGSNNDGVWNEQGVSLKITILPPFLATGLFRLLVLAFVILVTFTFITFRTYSIRKRNEQLELGIRKRTRELSEANQRAERQRTAAEEASKAKSMFLARMSHEIRTPMNGVIGFTDILLDTELNDEQLDYVRTINRCGKSLLTLINDILDISKVEAGQLTLEPIDFDPEVMAFDICDLMVPKISGKPIAINCRIGDNVPAYVKGDAGRYRQVLINLMGNAIKFTEKGKIQLSIDVEEEVTDRIKLHAAIRDTGIGIPPQNLGTIFEVFHQADSSITRKYGGTGLGLSISKQIAQLMGGDVWAESEIEKGSTFHFTTWMAKSEKKPPEIRNLVTLSGKHVLIVDDNKSNLEVLTHTLESKGMRVTALENAHDVVPALQAAFSSGVLFSLCIIDIQMPGLSGYEVGKQIRSLASPLAEIPLMAFSSSTVARTRKYREAGFDGFIPKPLQRKKLIKMVRQLLADKDRNQERESVVTQYSIREVAKNSVHILLVEDHPINQRLIRFMLDRAGYRLDVANNGQQALEMVFSDPDSFDLIFMDIQMPVMDGIQATREIRIRENQGNPSHSRIPIIAMTAEAIKGTREKCLAVGMDDYISKPVRREDVFTMVKKWAMDKEV